MAGPEDTEYRNNYRRPTICDRMVFQEPAGVRSRQRPRYHDPKADDAPMRFERGWDRDDNALNNRCSPRGYYAPEYEYPRPKSRTPYSPNILALIRDWEDWAEQVGAEDSSPPPPMHHVHNPELRRLLEAGRSGIQALRERVYKDVPKSRPLSASSRAHLQEREDRRDDESRDARQDSERSGNADDAVSHPEAKTKGRSSSDSDRRRDRAGAHNRQDNDGDSSASSAQGRGEGQRAERLRVPRARRPLLRVYLSDSEDDDGENHRPRPQKNHLLEKSNVLRDVTRALSSSTQRHDLNDLDDRSPEYVATARKYDDGSDGPHYIGSARQYNRDDSPIFGLRRRDRFPKRDEKWSPTRFEDSDDDDYGHCKGRRYAEDGDAASLKLKCENKFLKQELCNVRWEMSRFRKKCEEILADQRQSYTREMERIRGSISEHNLRFQFNEDHRADHDTNNRMRRRLEQHFLRLGRSWNENMYENVAERGFSCERPFVDPLDFEKRINRLRVIDL